MQRRCKKRVLAYILSNMYPLYITIINVFVAAATTVTGSTHNHHVQFFSVFYNFYRFLSAVLTDTCFHHCCFPRCSSAAYISGLLYIRNTQARFLPVTQTTTSKHWQNPTNQNVYKNWKFTLSIRVMYTAMFFNSKLLGRLPVLRWVSMYTLHRLTRSLIASSTALVSMESAVHTVFSTGNTLLYGMLYNG